MNNLVLVILLSSQMLLNFIFPIVRRLKQGFHFPDTTPTKFSTNLFLVFNVLLPITSTILFLINYFSEGASFSPAILKLTNMKKLNLEIGYNFSLVAFLFFLSIFLSLSLIILFLRDKIPKWSNDYLDRVYFISSILLLVIFSPNFFQFVICIVIIDVLVLEFVKKLNLDVQKKITKSFYEMLFVFVIGDLFILSSIILLLKRTMTFDFAAIFVDIETKFFILSPYFKTISFLFVIGLLTKFSIFPFHSWNFNVLSETNYWLFALLIPFLSPYLLFLLISPYSNIVVNIKLFLYLFGLCVGLFSIIVAVFVQNFNKKIDLLYSLVIGFFFMSFGIDQYLISYQLLLLLPIIFVNFIVLSNLTSETEIVLEEDNQKSSKMIITIAAVSLPMLSLMGIPPFNTVLIGITSFVSSGTQFSLLVLLLYLISQMFVFCACMQLLVHFLKKRKGLEISLLLKYIVVSILILISLVGLVFPYFQLLYPFESDINFQNVYFLYSALPLAIVYFLIPTSYLLFKKFFPSLVERVSVFFAKISLVFEKFYYFDFIFETNRLFYIILLKPLIKKFTQVVIINICYTFLFKKIIISILNWVKTLFKEVILPQVKRFFTKLSQIIRTFETTSLKKQLFIVFLFIFLIILLIFFIPIGGSLQ
ncbi:MAG: hypothetical protein ACTSSG_04065 [Candidatus Heimdallarchaeaceae archaeon]